MRLGDILMGRARTHERAENDGQAWLTSMVELGRGASKTEISTVECVAALLKARTPEMYSTPIVRAARMGGREDAAGARARAVDAAEVARPGRAA